MPSLCSMLPCAVSVAEKGCQLQQVAEYTGRGHVGSGTRSLYDEWIGTVAIRGKLDDIVREVDAAERM